MNRPLTLAFTLLLWGGWADSAVGQEDDPPARERVELRDGSVYIGVITAESDSTLSIRLDSGQEIEVRNEQVTLRRLADARTADPNRTRLLFAPTARPIPRGTGYLADYYVFFPFVGIGVQDVLSLAGGISLIPGVGLGNQLLYLAPKLTAYQDARTSLAVGALYARLPDDEGAGGVLFAVGTRGSSERAVSLGIGFGYGNGEVARKPALMVGGEVQVSNSVKLLSENYVFVGVFEGVLVSGGVRFFGDHLAADLGLITSPFILDDAEGFPFAPLVSFAYNFSR